MIPKTIHYCWFGKGKMPQQAIDCINSWHQVMPDWTYKLWNEDSFDINSIPYIKEAYEARKFAFVTDYVRLFALYTEGGVYMDTDVMVFKSYEDLLHLSAFTGYEGSKSNPPVTGTMASEVNGIWVKEQLDEYNGAHFLNDDGSFDMTTNTVRITRNMVKNGFIPNGKEQDYKDLHIFPTDYFCPRQTTGEYLKTENTYCDHLGACSWNTPANNWKSKLRDIIGQKNMTKLIKLKRKFEK